MRGGGRIVSAYTGTVLGKGSSTFTMGKGSSFTIGKGSSFTIGKGSPHIMLLINLL